MTCAACQHFPARKRRYGKPACTVCVRVPRVTWEAALAEVARW